MIAPNDIFSTQDSDAISGSDHRLVGLRTLCGSSSNVEHPTFQWEDGGSSPTLPLQIKDMKCYPCNLKRVARIVEEWHYSKTVWGVNWTYCFEMRVGETQVGAAIVGQPATKSVADKHGGLGNVLELRRFCCREDAPKNSESFFLGWMLRWLKKNTEAATLLSFADTLQGHEGTIYKASNFQEVGRSKPETAWKHNGKIYHHKSMHNKSHKTKKYYAHALELQRARDAGELERVKLPPKICYAYRLRSLPNANVDLPGTAAQDSASKSNNPAVSG